MSVIGGANLRDFFVYTTSGGYGTFWSKMHANLGFLVAVQCVGGLAVVLLPLQLNVTCSRRRVLPIAVAMLVALVLLGAGRGPVDAAGFAAGLVWLKTSKKRRKQRRAVMLGSLLLLFITGFLGVARGAAASREVTFGNAIGGRSDPEITYSCQLLACRLRYQQRFRTCMAIATCRYSCSQFLERFGRQSPRTTLPL